LKFGYIRAIAYATVVFVAAVALTFVPRLPDNRAADVMFSQAAAPTWKLRFDTLGKGESLQRVLRRGGLSDTAAIRAIQAASTLDERRIPAGMPITIRSETADSAPSEVIFHLAVDKIIRLKRAGDDWIGAQEKLPWTIDTIVVSGTIQSNVYAAIDESASEFLPSKARIQLTGELSDVYSFKIDMTRELQKGDQFNLIAERATGPNGAVRIESGCIIAASFTLSRSMLRAFRFPGKFGSEYFDENGKSMRTAFMRYPVDFRRISSTFGNRFHPILGYTRAHKGTDYAADAGTPVKAIGDGTVLRATWDNGYGNLAEIRHPNGFVTRYGHMKAFAKGIHSGTRVQMGQVIGYVGMTGLATGPHLHFEVLIAGEQHDPQSAFKKQSGEPIPKAKVVAFQSVRDSFAPKLDGIPRDRAMTLSAAITQH
jgi:murein DD-endopeptidase MepM/ murein hydrolase activator NlpD